MLLTNIMFRVLRQKVTCTLHQCDVVDWTAKLCVSIQTAITKMKCGLVLLAILASLLHAAFCLSRKSYFVLASFYDAKVLIAINCLHTCEIE